VKGGQEMEEGDKDMKNQTDSSNPSMINRWWTLQKEEISEILKVDFEKGLSKAQVKEYRTIFGANALIELKRTSNIALLFEGVRQPMMILLLSIAAISFIFGETVEAVVMILVVGAYVSVEFINKSRADHTMAHLRELTQPTTKVIREEEEQEIPTTDVVVADLVILSTGVRIPADARLIKSSGLVVNEAPLTGESQPVRKNADAEVPETPTPADRVNSVFSGTTILDGEGKAVVMAVGNQSEFGKIAKEVQAIQKERTPLQQAMTNLTKILAIFAVVVSFIIPIIGFLRGFDFQQMVLTWLALTFLMVPGQPPVIITMALALASFELAKKHVVVKRLRGAETLGSVTAILTDKTGTITENKMRVERFVLPDGQEIEPQKAQALKEIFLALPEYPTDPTDRAIAEVFSKDLTREKPAPLFFAGFSEGHPWRTLTYRKNGIYTHVLAGKPELLIESSTLHTEGKEKLEGVVTKEGYKGNRVVAFASFDSKTKELENLHGTKLLALAVLEDPVRKGMREAVTTLRNAGIKTFVVTGDHPATTQAVAEKIGLSGEIITGDQLEKMSDDALHDALRSFHLFARTGPLQKLRLVKTLQSQGENVAVIGDGINDAPAIRSANVGVAMGEIGTDLAKETADLVLTDDNYAHVPDAVAIGRKAIDNFRKGLTYYLSAKTILLSIFIVPLALGIPFPLAPIHIILVELLMDLASSTIFVTEVAEPDVLKRLPQKTNDYLRHSIALGIFRNGIGLILGILTIYLWLYIQTGDLVLAQTAAFATWLLGHIFLALNLKQERVPLLKQGIFSNRFGAFWLLGMIALTMVMTNIQIVFPYLKTISISLLVWLEIILVALVSTFWIEARKLLRERTGKIGQQNL